MSEQTLTTTSRNARMLGLDLLRLAAIVLVMGRHMDLPPEGWHPAIRKVLAIWQANGGLGVDLFFVLSGFLVSGLLFNEFKKRGDISVTRFYVRRAWKIYPSFYVLILFSCLYQIFVIQIPIERSRTLSEVFFVQSYVQGFWNHTWTLAIEEHFYIILPILLLVVLRASAGLNNPFRRIPAIVATISVVILGARIVNYLLRPEYTFYTHDTPSHLRVDSLLFGVVIAYAYHFHAEWFQRTLRPWRYAMIVAGAAALGTWVYLPRASDFYCATFGCTQSYLGAGAILIGVVLCNIPSNAVMRALAAVGAFSYSIYLWHMAVMYWGNPYFRLWNWSWELRMAIYFVCAFAVGIVMSKLVEYPMLRLRDWLVPARDVAPIREFTPTRVAA